MTRREISFPRPGDQGAAMIITLMVLALVTALATTVAVVSIRNMQSARQAQQAGAALNAADAGLAQALAHLRSAGVRGLTCGESDPANPSSTPSTECALPWTWGDPAEYDIPGRMGQAYSVWVQMATPVTPQDPGEYIIHSVGTAGDASRRVRTSVTVSAINVPKGIVARAVEGGGTADVHRQSIFATGCVYRRGNITMDISRPDLTYGIPPAVHSSQIITDSNGSGEFCPTTNQPIHRKPSRYVDPLPCNPAWPYDQDLLGDDLSSLTLPEHDACKDAQEQYPDYYGSQDFDGDGEVDVIGSKIKDERTLLELFDLRSPVLTQAEISRLRNIAEAQGNLWLTAKFGTVGGWVEPGPEDTHAVLFFDLTAAATNDRTVNLDDLGTRFRRAESDLEDLTNCPTRSLIIIVEGGNARLNQSTQGPLAASLFLLSGAPYGKLVKAAGNSAFIGTIYADNVDLTGTSDMTLDKCFLANVSPSLMDFSTHSYRELDR